MKKAKEYENDDPVVAMLNEFTKDCVNLHKLENGRYGYNPFHLRIKNGGVDYTEKMEHQNDVLSYYNRISFVSKKADYLMAALDFPPVMEIETDFVAILLLDNVKRVKSIIGLPYDPLTGATKEVIYDTPALDTILEQYKMSELIYTRKLN
tara:strand:+ start:982 stop:1434 length:453 start_codon:yes stop_codon:yes gene_type:complete